MNNVTISALLKGKIEQVEGKPDTVTFVLAQKGRDDEILQFRGVAYGETAKFLETVESGSRLVVSGRISSEKFEEDGPYHNVVSVSKVISAGGKGSDYGHVSMIANVTTKEFKRVGAKGQGVINVNLVGQREFKKKDGEVVIYKTYVDGSIWGEKAESMEASLPIVDERMLVTGTISPRSYENNKGQTVEKLEIFVDTIDPLGGAVITSLPQKHDGEKKAAPSRPAPSRPVAIPTRGAKKTEDEDLKF